VNHYASEILAAQRTADYRREADQARIARTGRRSGGSLDGPSFLRRLGARLVHRSSWQRGIERPLRPATGG
jgi:hypothetical protein